MGYWYLERAHTESSFIFFQNNSHFPPLICNAVISKCYILMYLDPVWTMLQVATPYFIYYGFTVWFRIW